MTPDLYQLPIPDWDVQCPVCRYPLRGLPEHRCPECGTTFDMGKLVHTWTRLRPPRYTGRESPLPDFGLRCEHCGDPLAGAVDRRCGTCGAAFDLEALRPAGEWFDVGTPSLSDPKGVTSADIAAPLMGVNAPDTFDLDAASLAAELAEHLIPFVLHDEAQPHLGLLTRSHLRVASDYFLDYLAVLGSLRRSRLRPHRKAWRCPDCAKVVPGNFDICWNCGAAL